MDFFYIHNIEYWDIGNCTTKITLRKITTKGLILNGNAEKTGETKSKFSPCTKKPILWNGAATGIHTRPPWAPWSTPLTDWRRPDGRCPRWARSAKWSCRCMAESCRLKMQCSWSPGKRRFPGYTDSGDPAVDLQSFDDWYQSTSLTAAVAQKSPPRKPWGSRGQSKSPFCTCAGRRKKAE